MTTTTRIKISDDSLSVVGSETTAIARAMSILVGMDLRHAPMTYQQALDVIAWREAADRPVIVPMSQRVRRVLGFPTRH